MYIQHPLMRCTSYIQSYECPSTRYQRIHSTHSCGAHRTSKSMNVLAPGINVYTAPTHAVHIVHPNEFRPGKSPKFLSMVFLTFKRKFQPLKFTHCTLCATKYSSAQIRSVTIVSPINVFYIVDLYLIL